MAAVCFFNTLHIWGGGEKWHFDHSSYFHDKKHDVVVVCSPGSELCKRALHKGLKIFAARAGNLSFLNPLFFISCYLFFRKHKTDTVVFSLSQDLKAASFAACCAGVRNIVYARALALPVKNSWLNRLIFNRWVTHVVCNSKETRKTFLQHLGPHISIRKVHVIYYGLHPLPQSEQPITNRQERPMQQNRVVIGNAGRLTTQKGQHRLIEMASLLKQQELAFTLLIAGTGPLEKTLQHEITKRGLQDQVQLTGFINDIPRFLYGIDIFVLTSEWEGFGYVLAEAMMQEKPVVAFRITSNPELVIEEKTGFLVPFPDIKMFTEKVAVLIRNESLRKQMGEAGALRIKQHFLFDDKASELEKLLGLQNSPSHK